MSSLFSLSVSLSLLFSLSLSLSLPCRVEVSYTVARSLFYRNARATLYKSFQTKRIFLKTYTCARSLSVQLCVRAESILAPYLLAKEARSPKSGIVKNALFFPNHTPNLT